MRLKELHLHNNKLGYEGVEKLCAELAKPLSKSSSKPGNKILEVLVLRNNGIGRHCDGMCGICRFSPDFPLALLQLTSLHLIDFNHNELVYVPLEIVKLPKLMGLDLRNNAIANIPDQVMVTARSGMQRNTPGQQGRRGGKPLTSTFPCIQRDLNPAQTRVANVPALSQWLG